MKKLFAIILAVAITATMLAVFVSADKEVGGADGVTTFDPTSTGKDLHVKVSDVVHKYAVDLTFSFDDLVIGGDISWNVNTMKYDFTGVTPVDTAKTITVTNRSDLSVYAYATASDADADDGIAVTPATYSDTNKLEVAKATAGTTGNGTATTDTLTINVTSTDWQNVVEYYAAKKANEGTDVFKIATVTVTISKDA